MTADGHGMPHLGMDAAHILLGLGNNNNALARLTVQEMQRACSDDPSYSAVQPRESGYWDRTIWYISAD